MKYRLNIYSTIFLLMASVNVVAAQTNEEVVVLVKETRAAIEKNISSTAEDTLKNKKNLSNKSRSAH